MPWRAGNFTGMETPDFGVPRRLAARLSMAEQHDYLRARLTRRRTLVTAGAVAGGLLTGCGGPPGGDGRSRTSSTARVPGSAVVPFGRHLALGADPRTGMRISWQVPAAVHRPYVRVGTRPDDLGEKIAAEVRTLDTPANLGYTDGRQTAWLGRRLKELRAADGVEFVVVFFHHCAYSTSSHGSDGGVRAEWVPLFAEHQVDLVINGHNHVYERTDAVKNGEVGRAVPIGGRTDPTRDGTVYVTAGGGGKELYGFPAGTPESYAGKVADAESVPTFHWTRSRLTRQERVTWSRVRYRGFSVLSVTAHAGPAPRLEVSALNQDGERVDTFEVRRGGRRPAAAGAQ